MHPWRHFNLNTTTPAFFFCIRYKTPAKRLTWQERPEDLSGKGVGARKREWGEVTPGGGGGGAAAAAAPVDSVYPSPMSSSASGWGPQSSGGRPLPRSSTPRERETPSWVFSSSGRESSRGGDGDGSSRKGQPAESWRRASADLGQAAMTAAAAAAAASASDSGEDSLGYPLLPCDGRECKIRIVERLGEIKGSRASNAASEAPLEGGGGSSGGSGEFVQGLLAAGGGGGGGGAGAGSVTRRQALSARVASSASTGLVLGGGGHR